MRQNIPGTSALGDACAQSRRVLGIIGGALAQAGAKPSDALPTRVHAAKLGRGQEAAGCARGGFLDVRPAATVARVSGLIAPEMLAEIELNPVVGEGL